MFTQKELDPVHEKEIKKLLLPDWIFDHECPECGKKITLHSVRGVGLAMGAKNIGDFVIEVHCKHCNSGYSLHAVNACDTISDFIIMLRAFEYPFDEPMVPDYKMSAQKNNLVRKMLSDPSHNDKDC